MYVVYVIASITHGTRYVGSTDAIERRIYEHNSGRVRYTKGRLPWKLIYTESFSTRSEAMKREYFLKTGYGRKILDEILSTAAGSSNGRTADSESAYPGSNPGPAAVDGI